MNSDPIRKVKSILKPEEYVKDCFQRVEEIKELRRLEYATTTDGLLPMAQYDVLRTGGKMVAIENSEWFGSGPAN